MNATPTTPTNPTFEAARLSDTRIRTGKVRVSYQHLLEPAAVNGGEPKYSASILIPKSDTQCIQLFEEVIQEVVKKGVERYGRSFQGPKLHLPIHDGDEEKPNDPDYAGFYYINISGRQQPQIVGPDRRPLTDPAEIYSGMWGRFTVNVYAYSAPGNCGVSVGLQNFQKLEDDEPLGGSRTSAAADFGAPDDDDFFA